MNAQWSQLIYSLLICFGAGTLAFLGASEAMGKAGKSRKAAAIAAALLLLAGGAAFFLSVGKPSAAIAVATNAAKGSPKSLEFVGAIVCLAVAIAYAIVVFRASAYEDDDEVDTGTVGKVLGIVALVCGIALPLLSGHAASVGRASWMGVAGPAAYLGNALTMGGALFASICVVRSESPSCIRLFAIIAAGVTVLQTICFIVFAVNAGAALDAVVFWLGAVVVGCVASLTCLAASLKMRAAVFGAVACSVVGAVILRLAVTALGTTSLGLIANAASRTPL